MATPKKPAPKPSPSPSTMQQKIDWTENEYMRLLKKGVMPNQARKQAMSKYNIYPNGDTN